MVVKALMDSACRELSSNPDPPSRRIGYPPLDPYASYVKTDLSFALIAGGRRGNTLLR